VNILVWIGRSPIAGYGLFAGQDIRKGVEILQYTGEKISKAESARRVLAGNAYIFELTDKWDIDGTSLSNIARYINHSCAPNCEVQKTSRTLWIVARRTIKKGEELTYNYGYDRKEVRCHCGAKNCCGYILDRKYWKCI
jgi:SET domain-containing protein